jgi:ABC-2 type transport system permease protein
MVWLITKKELLENLLDQRFLISLVLAALISWASTFVLSVNYTAEVDEFHERVNFQNRILNEQFTMQSWDGGLAMPPKPIPLLSPIARGITKDLTVYGSIDENPVPVIFPLNDILFSIGIIMSIAAMTLSYDKISGEKEAGMLKMLMTGSVSRARILLGKWLGGILSLGMILVVVFSGSILIALCISGSAWAATEWLSVISLFILSVAYCSSFYSLGLFISAKNQTSSDSVLISLLSWVILTLIMPTIPPYIASLVYPTPSPAKLQYEAFFEIKQQRDNAVNRLKAPLASKGIGDDQIAKELEDEVKRIDAEYNTQEEKLKEMVIKQSLVRESITAMLHFFSPYSSYRLAGAELTATGAMNQVFFIEEAQGYVNNLYRRYLPKKVKEAKAMNPTYSESSRLDIRDRPAFHYEDEQFSYRMAGAAIHSLFILLFSLLFWALAWRAFLTYDPR